MFGQREIIHSQILVIKFCKIIDECLGITVSDSLDKASEASSTSKTCANKELEPAALSFN